MKRIATSGTLERKAIAMTQMATSGANLRGIGWLKENNRNSLGISLILDKASELSEGPSVCPPPLPFTPLFCGLPDVGQVFHCHSRSLKACGPFNQPLADCVVCIGLKPSLSPRKPLENLSAGASAPGLQTPSHPLVMVFSVLKRSSPEKPAFIIGRGGNRKVVLPQVNTDDIGSFREGKNFYFFGNGYMKEVSLPSSDEPSATDMPAIIQVLPLVVATKEGNFLSPLNGIDRDNIMIDSEVPGEVELNRVSIKGRLDHLPIGSHRAISPHDLSTSSAGHLRAKAKALSQILIDYLLELQGIGKGLSLPGYSRSIIHRLVEGINRPSQNRVRGLKFNLNGASCLHSLYYNILVLKKQASIEGKYASIPPPPKGGGFLDAIL